MIAKGNLHGNGGKLAQYMLTGDNDETVELVEARRLEYLSRDPVQAFKTLQAIAEANSKADMPFFHSQTRLAPGEHLTDAQWLKVADREEKRLGFSGQPRLVTFHVFPNGEKHLHVGWFRIDLETMRAIDSGMYKNHLKQLCRKLEKEFGLQEVGNERKPEDRARIADRKEVEEARRLGTDARAIRNKILDCLQRTDSGKAFRAALGEHGLMLANGDRRDCFVVIDQAGGQHALNKKLTGLTLAAMRDRLADLDRSQLPGVDQAKAMQKEKHPERAQKPDKGRDTAQTEPARSPQSSDNRPEARHPAYAHEPAAADKLTRASLHFNRKSWHGFGRRPRGDRRSLLPSAARMSARPGICGEQFGVRPPRRAAAVGGIRRDFRSSARSCTGRAAPLTEARHSRASLAAPRHAPIMPLPIAIGHAREERRGQLPTLTRFPRPAMNDGIKPHMQQFAEGYGEIDPMASGDAAAAAAAVSAQYEGLIDAIRDNLGMSPEQKAAAISGLRQRQSAEAAAASAAIMAAAGGAAAARRETMRLARARPARQQDAPALGETAQLVDRSGSSPDSRNRPAPGEIAPMFRAAAEGMSQCAEAPQPKARRRRGGETRGAFGMAAKPMLRHAAPCSAVARGRYAALLPVPQATAPADAYAHAAMCLSHTLEWLNLWQDNADTNYWLDDEFNANQHQCFSQP